MKVFSLCHKAHVPVFAGKATIGKTKMMPYACDTSCTSSFNLQFTKKAFWGKSEMP